MPSSSPFRALAVAAALGSMTVVSACAGGLSGNDYSRGQVGVVSRTEAATIIEVRPVTIEGTKSGVGAAAGAAIGGAAGSEIGGGRAENFAGGVAGAVIGGLLGAAIEEGATNQAGVAYVVRIDATGETLTITQADAQPMPPGARVWIEYGPRTRVVPRY